MRTIRLACLICVACAAPCAAYADLPVVDPAAIAQTASESAKALAQAAQQLEALQQQYEKLQETYTALAHIPNIDNLTPGLNTQAILNPLSSVDQVPNVANGTNLGSFTGVGQQYLSQNRYYATPGDDQNAQEMNRQATATAGVQAMAYANLQATQERIDQIPALREEIGSANNQEDVTAVVARIAADQDAVQTLQAQAQQLQLLQTAQQEVTQQRKDQKQRQDADSLFNDTAALN